MVLYERHLFSSIPDLFPHLAGTSQTLWWWLDVTQDAGQGLTGAMFARVR